MWRGVLYIVYCILYMALYIGKKNTITIYDYIVYTYELTKLLVHINDSRPRKHIVNKCNQLSYKKYAVCFIHLHTNHIFSGHLEMF